MLLRKGSCTTGGRIEASMILQIAVKRLYTMIRQESTFQALVYVTLS